MASLTIRNIDDDLKQKLTLRAARNGLSVEEDLRRTLLDLVVEAPSEKAEPVAAGEAEGARPIASRAVSPDAEAAVRERLARIRKLAHRPDEPIDWKAVTDELYDFLP